MFPFLEKQLAGTRCEPVDRHWRKAWRLAAAFLRSPREKAAMGVLITLQPSTKPMEVEAASAGFYVHKMNRQDP
jgi:hypothetical protein